MKKIFALILALILVCGAALAAEIAPMESIDLATETFEDCFLHVGFKLDALKDGTLVADVYTQQIYDIVDIAQLAAGDTIIYDGEPVTVERIDDTSVGKDINGGLEEGGITLLTEEDTNGFIAYHMDTPAYLLLGCAELKLGDSILLTHWKQDELGGIMDEVDAQTVEPAQVKDALTAFDEGDAFYPAALRVHVVNGVIDEIHVDYVP